ALVKFLAGKSLPGVETLENSFSKFDSNYEDYVVVGSNVVDTSVHAPVKFNEIDLGDKVKIEENFSKQIGGGGINVSVSLRRLGAKVGYLGKLSQETLDMIKTHLRKEGVSLIPSKPTDFPGAKSILL